MIIKLYNNNKMNNYKIIINKVIKSIRIIKLRISKIIRNQLENNRRK